MAATMGFAGRGWPQGGPDSDDLYALGWEAGYRAAYQDLIRALMMNPTLNGRRLARLLRDLARSARQQLASRQVAG